MLQLAVTSDTMPRDELTALVNDVISERLAAVPGVADVQINGSQQKAFDIDVDQIKLASLGLTVGDVRNALSTIAFDSLAGSLNGTNQRPAWCSAPARPIPGSAPTASRASGSA